MVVKNSVCMFFFISIFASYISTSLCRRYGKNEIHLGAVLPKTSLLTFQRAYFKRMSDAIENLNKNKYMNFNFTKQYKVAQGPWLMMPLSASPLEILKTLCDHLLLNDVVTIIYFTNSETYGINAASVQYLLQLTGYMGIPVLAWNVDNLGLYQVTVLLFVNACVYRSTIF